MSLPSRGAWIEITTTITGSRISRSRSPHGERGLKLQRRQVGAGVPGSLPSRGAWIEILVFDRIRRTGGVAPLTGSVD